MLPFPTTREALKMAWPTLLVGAVAIAAFIVLIVLASRGCGGSTGGDYFEDAKKQILDEVASEQAANRERLKALESELFDLRDQVDALDAEVQESAREREEIHDAIDHASTIDDVDRILRSGIPGVSGRRDR